MYDNHWSLIRAMDEITIDGTEKPRYEQFLKDLISKWEFYVSKHTPKRDRIVASNSTFHKQMGLN
jgi:hypothetical protein